MLIVQSHVAIVQSSSSSCYCPLAVIKLEVASVFKGWKYQLVLSFGLNLHLNKLLLTGFAAVKCFLLWTSIDILRECFAFLKNV